MIFDMDFERKAMRQAYNNLITRGQMTPIDALFWAIGWRYDYMMHYMRRIVGRPIK